MAVVGRTDLAADDDHASIREGRLARAVEIREGRGGERERAGRRIPDPRVVTGRPDEDLAGRQLDHVLGLDAPVEERPPFAAIRRSVGERCLRSGRRRDDGQRGRRVVRTAGRSRTRARGGDDGRPEGACEHDGHGGRSARADAAMGHGVTAPPSRLDQSTLLRPSVARMVPAEANAGSSIRENVDRRQRKPPRRPPDRRATAPRPARSVRPTDRTGDHSGAARRSR